MAVDAGIPTPPPCVYYTGPKTSLKMSRPYKIALILRSRSNVAVYVDLTRMSDSELEVQVQAVMRRMRRDESAVIARMVMHEPTVCLN